MSRRTQLTAEVQARIVEALKAGAFFRDACDYAGVSRKVAYEWLRFGRDGTGNDAQKAFASAVDNARGTWRVGAQARISQAGEKDWRAIAWQLERHDQHKELRLRLKKLQVETEVLRKRADGTLPPDRHEITSVDLDNPDAVAKRLADLHARATGTTDASGTGGGAGTDGSGES